jgi:hypothetical protein
LHLNTFFLKKPARALLVARERFELSSMAPKATMLDHYTNGLLASSFRDLLFIVRGLKDAFFHISVPTAK